MGMSQEFDEILTELGDFGKYQIRQYIFISIPTLFVAAFTVTYVFTAGNVPHRCQIDACGDTGSRSEFLPEWWKSAIPHNEKGIEQPAPCLMYKPIDNNSCKFDITETQTCNKWVYSGNETTIQTAFSLACPDNAWKLTSVGTLNNLGRLIGLPLIGFISDKYGRKCALLLTLIASSILGIIRAFSPTYGFFITLEFLEAMFSGSSYGILFIYAMELVSPKRREMGGAILVWSYALGQAFLALIASALKDWRHILLAVYAPSLAFILYIWIIPESLRWLLLRGKVDEAKKLIQNAAEINGKTLSAQCEEKLLKLGTNSEDTDDKGDPTWVALKKVFQSRKFLLRLLNCSFCWVTNTLVYYGLSLNAVTLAGTEDKYINFILVSVVEAPGYLIVWFGMSYIGRRKTLCSALIISGIACLTSPLLQGTGYDWAQVTLYLIGKLAITGSFDTLYVFTAEIFPTRLRTSMLSTCSMIGRIGSMLAPQTLLLQLVSPILPMLVFGSVALLAGLLSLFFPETKGKALPDSVEDAIALGSVSEEDNNIENKTAGRMNPTFIITSDD